VIGVNSGAGVAVVLLMAFLPGFSFLSPIFAFFGALGASVLLLLLCRLLGGSRVTLVLLGTAANALFGAVISFFTLLDSDLLSLYHSFSIGGLADVGGESLVLPAVIILLSLLFALLLSPRLAILSLGDLRAASLGIQPARLRFFGTLAAAASAAAVVSFAGLLGFVGLIVPHLARLLSPPSPRHTLAVSAMLGASLLLLADLLSRLLLRPTEIPVGILTAMLGAPFFLLLLLRQRGGDGR
jgi:iron complex transport system permease protein